MVTPMRHKPQNSVTQFNETENWKKIKPKEVILN